MQTIISAIVICKNEEEQIYKCLKSLSFTDEIIIIDSGSTDNTLEIAKKFTKNIYETSFTNFSDLRNLGKDKSLSDWVLYVDADEEVSLDLQKEIIDKVNNDQGHSAFYLIRKNFYLGKEWPVKEKLERLFKKKDLGEWYGEVHESPKVKGEKGQLRNELNHYTHNSLEEMLKNTIVWSDFEAKARLKVNHPKITWWRIIRMMLTSFWDYYIKQRGWTVGTVGLIESIYQAFSVFVTYGKLWEMQKRL